MAAPSFRGDDAAYFIPVAESYITACPPPMADENAPRTRIGRIAEDLPNLRSRAPGQKDPGVYPSNPIGLRSVPIRGDELGDWESVPSIVYGRQKQFLPWKLAVSFVQRPPTGDDTQHGNRINPKFGHRCNAFALEKSRRQFLGRPPARIEPGQLARLGVVLDGKQTTTDNGLLVPVVEVVRRRCGESPGKVSADSGFFVLEDLKVLAQQKIDAYVPDSNLARMLNRGGRLRCRARDPVHRQMRRKLRGRAGRAIYARRKALIEPVFGVLKEQRGLRQFRRRGLEKAAVEVALATTAYNLTRLWRSRSTG